MVRGVGSVSEVRDAEVRRGGIGWWWRVLYMPGDGRIGHEVGGWALTRWGAERKARRMREALVESAAGRGPDRWERIDP